MSSQLITVPKSGENKKKPATYEEGFVAGMTVLLIIQDPFVQKVATKICTTTVAAVSSSANKYIVTPITTAVKEAMSWLTTRKLTPQEEEIIRLKQELSTALAEVKRLNESASVKT